MLRNRVQNELQIYVMQATATAQTKKRRQGQSVVWSSAATPESDALVPLTVRDLERDSRMFAAVTHPLAWVEINRLPPT